MIRVTLSDGGRATVSHLGARVELQGVSLLVDDRRVARRWQGSWLDEHGRGWDDVVLEVVDAPAVTA